jgi:hypothetical protein
MILLETGEKQTRREKLENVATPGPTRFIHKGRRVDEIVSYMIHIDGVHTGSKKLLASIVCLECRRERGREGEMVVG